MLQQPACALCPCRMLLILRPRAADGSCLLRCFLLRVVRAIGVPQPAGARASSFGQTGLQLLCQQAPAHPWPVRSSGAALRWRQPLISWASPDRSGRSLVALQRRLSPPPAAVPAETSSSFPPFRAPVGGDSSRTSAIGCDRRTEGSARGQASARRPRSRGTGLR